MGTKKNILLGGVILLGLITSLTVMFPLFIEQSWSYFITSGIILSFAAVILWLGKQVDTYKLLWKKVTKDKKKYETAFDNNLTCMWQIDGSNQEVTFSQGMHAILGKEVDELTFSYEAWEKLLYPGELDRLLDYIHSIREGKIAHY